MSEEFKKASSGIIFGLEDKPPFGQAALAALQHLMSMFISIGAPPTIICKTMGMSNDIVIYMACLAFFVSGIGTFIQTNRFGPLGSGLLSIQATSFIFLGAFIAIGFSAKATRPGITDGEIVALMTAAVILGSFVQMALSRMSGVLRVVFTPLVCGITVTMVGVSLIKVGMDNLVGGPQMVKTLTMGRELSPELVANMLAAVKDVPNVPPALLDLISSTANSLQSIVLRSADYAALKNVGVGALVLLVIVIFNCFKSPALRMGAMLFGFIAGVIAAALFTDLIKLPPTDVIIAQIKSVQIPVPLKYGVDFSVVGLGGFVSVLLLYVVSTMEATGDLAATSMLSKRPTEGPEFIGRLQGGILCDGFASLVAGIFNSFPMAIFAQNNGVIQLTGNASRHVGKYVAVYLFILGLLPGVGFVFSIIPAPVLGGALILLFGIIAATGMRIIFSEPVGRRSVLIIGISIGAGVGAGFHPDFSRALPYFLQDLLHSQVAVGAIMAIITNLLLPNYKEEAVEAEGVH